MTRARRPPPFAWLLGASAALLVVRWAAAARVGFGDSEALYASYALHPQPAYLDHPGLVGVFARAIGGGSAPGPLRAHVVTAVLATLVPWIMAAACRACGARPARAWAAALVFALTPEIAIGLFAMTPDLLVALTWTAALAFAGWALRSEPRSARADAGFCAAGVLAGAAAAAKVSGLGLMAALALTYASRPARRHARSLAPWAGLAAGLLVLGPVFAYEARAGWPMLRHRLVETQHGAGLSWRNAGALVGGQLAYLSPLTALLAVFAGRTAWRERRDATGTLLLACTAVPLAGLLPLCLWSRVAEPHWIAPALLALVPAAARSTERVSRRLVAASCALAAALVVAVHAWVLIPSLSRAVPGYDARIDLANELVGWPDVVRAVRDRVRDLDPSGRRDLAVVGPHWVICAQLEAALKGELPVGCDSPVRDDFDDWLPRDRWRRATILLWVSDTRFPRPPDLPFFVADPAGARRVTVARGGRVVRTFTVSVLTRVVTSTTSRHVAPPR